MAAPLFKIRVLDLSRILAGPWASQTLADLGADVIKVERPGSGDDTRTWGPPFAPGTHDSTYFLGVNRSKRSLAIDFTAPKGADVIRRLARESDVLIENFKVGGLKTYGLNYEALRALNPRLIYCSITGFGQTGLYKDRPGYDALIQAMGGLMSITGEADGPPQKVGVAITDIMTGMFATTAILAALHERSNSGLGQHIDLALLDVQLATLANQASAHLIAGVNPQRMGNHHPSIAPYQPFASKDGWVFIAVGNDAQFATFCALAGCTALAHDPKFKTNESRVLNRLELEAHLAPSLQRKTSSEWTELGALHGVPIGPVNSVAEAFQDPHVLARGCVMEAGGIRTVASPLRFSRTPVTEPSKPPGLGEHTVEILSAFGFTAAELTALHASGAIDG